MEFQKFRKDLNERTVFVSINGTIGNVAFYNGEPIVLGKSACYFNLASNISKNFIKLILQSPYFKLYSSTQATGSTIKNLGLAAMNSFLIPLPPLCEQERIVTRVDKLVVICNSLSAMLDSKRQIEVTIAESLVEQVLA